MSKSENGYKSFSEMVRYASINYQIKRECGLPPIPTEEDIIIENALLSKKIKRTKL